MAMLDLGKVNPLMRKEGVIPANFDLHNACASPATTEKTTLLLHKLLLQVRTQRKLQMGTWFHIGTNYKETSTHPH